MTDLQTRIAALTARQRAQLEERVARLAATRATGGRERIRPRDRSRPTPLSYAQQREWALERFRPSNNIIGAMRMEGDVDLDVLSRALTEITARHEVLRSTVEVVDGTPVQVVQPVRPVPIPVVDLTGLPPQRQEAAVRRHFDAEVERPFPPQRVPRMRATMLRLDPRTWIGLLIVHHAASDGWSTALVVHEAIQLYRAFHEGRGSPLPPLEIQYGDFAVWQREHLTEEWMAGEVRYWRQVLAGMPPRLALPTDRPYPARRTFEAAQHPVTMPRDMAIAVHRLAEDQNASISMIMLTAMSVMLYRYTGQDDLVFGSAITARNRIETEPLIGCFANVLPLRMRVSRNQTLREVLRHAREVVATAFDHQDFPFDRLVEELAPRETTQTPLIQMMINVLTTPGELFRTTDQAVEMSGLRISPEPVRLGPIPIDMILIVNPRPESIELHWHYSSELFDAGTVIRLANQFSHIMDQLVHELDRRVGEVHLLDTATVTSSPVKASAGETFRGFVDVFQQQVALAPDATAVAYQGSTLSYEELNRDANRLAHHLRAMGVAAETPVGVLVDRSPRLAIAVLGVLKAGGAFIVVEPDQARSVLSGLSVPVVVTTPELAGQVEGTGARVVLVDDGDGPDTDLPDSPAPGQAAYLAHPAGSTGVVVSHRSLVTYATEAAARLQLGAGDRYLQYAESGSDGAVEELFPVWTVGGSVVFPAAGTRLIAAAEAERATLVRLLTGCFPEPDGCGQARPGWLRLVIVPPAPAPGRTGVPLMSAYRVAGAAGSAILRRLPSRPGDTAPGHLPLGTPLPSVRAHILDAELRPVPAGGTGELYLGGPTIARGYLGRAGLTAQRFVADPLTPGQRLYRTGDLACRRADGTVELVGHTESR
jgi:non-ribosomal peptide synthetase component F